MTYVDATEADLSSKASEKAEEIVNGRRKKLNSSKKKNGAPPTSSKKRGADGNMSCPVMAAIAASHPLGRRTRTSTSKPPAEVAADPKEDFKWSGTSPAFVAAMRGMTPEGLLECLEVLNVSAAAKVRVELEEARQLQQASKKALADASKQARTNEGRRTWQMLLTAAAYDGDETSRVSSKRLHSI